MPSSSLVPPQLDLFMDTAWTAAGPTAAGHHQAGDGGTGSSAHPQAELHPHCLYFLVCKVRTGPLAGLFKLGITNCLPRRHSQHRRVWGEFDLGRSALVRAESRDEIKDLEEHLHKTFRGRKLKARAKATNQELIAAGSCRRHPGQRSQGWTEFYAVKYQDKILETTEHLVGRRCERGVEMSLQRGITAADLTAPVAADGDAPPSLARGSASGQRVKVPQSQERDERDAREIAKVEEVLDFALAHEAYLRWVNLNWWRRLRNEFGRVGGSSSEGLVDLYFGSFGPARGGPDAGPAHRSATQVCFEENFARLGSLAAPIPPRRWHQAKPREVYSLRDLRWTAFQVLPHPVCTDTLRLRVEPVLSDLYHPLFERFETLSKRAKERLDREKAARC